MKSKPIQEKEFFLLDGIPYELPEPYEMTEKEKEFVRLDGLHYALQVTDEASLCFEEIGPFCIPQELRCDFLGTKHKLRKFRTSLIDHIRDNK